MKIEKIGNNRLQIHVTSDDLSKREMDIKDLWQNGPRAQQLFWEIVTMAYDKYGFVVEDGMVLVEAIGLIPDGVVVILTKHHDRSGDHHQDLQSAVRKSRKPPKKRLRKKGPRELVFRFDDLDHLIQCVHSLREFQCLENHLFQYRQVYYLYIRLVGQQQRLSRQIQAILSEYATYGEQSPCVIREYGTVVVKDPIKVFLRHFSDETGNEA